MKAIQILSLIIIVLTVSCHKDDEPEIIEPGSYFPVYPNSWWKYLVNDYIEIIDSTSQTYILYSYTIDDSYHNQHYSNVAYVPWYYSSDLSPVGITGPIFKYDQKLWHKWYGDILWPILSEEIGFVFERRPGDQYPALIENVTVKEKIFDGHDSILILEGRFYLSYEPFSTEKRLLEYAKGIGLVRDIQYDTITNDTIHKKILIDYHISN